MNDLKQIYLPSLSGENEVFHFFVKVTEYSLHQYQFVEN